MLDLGWRQGSAEVAQRASERQGWVQHSSQAAEAVAVAVAGEEIPVEVLQEKWSYAWWAYPQPIAVAVEALLVLV